MSEKPEAFCEANYEILRVTNSGEFIWNENADQMIRDPVFTEANPAIIYVVRALRQAEVIRQENERMREALKKYGRHLDDCALTLGGYQCTCGFNQQEVPR